MFSLRDSSSACSSGTDEDSFGWWIGVESHAQLPEPSVTEPPSVSSESAISCTGSDDVPAPNALIVATTTSASPTHSRRSSEEAEHIELRSLNLETLAVPTSDDRGALCYTPERLIRNKDYRILVPGPRRYPTLADLLDAQRRTFEKEADGGRIVETKDDRKIGAADLAELLQSPCRSAAILTRSTSRRHCCHYCCVRYGDGEVLLQHDGRTEDGLPDTRLRPYSVHGWCCSENNQQEEDSRGSLRESNVQSRNNSFDNTYSRDSEGKESSVDSGTRVDDCSCTTEEIEAEDGEDSRLSTKLFRRLSDELAYVSLEYTLSENERQTDRSSEVNEVSSILAELENNPSRAEALLLGEDRLRRSNHDCLARLALAIEPDGRQPTQDRHHRVLDSETELEQLRDRVGRLQDSSKDLHEEITQLRRDFMKDEWKVNHLSEDVNKLRNEVYELRYLDDLLKLLKGELERVSNRNWPFAIGHEKHETEELNLVV